MAEMTSRERVLAALNHEEPDRIPLDIGGGSSTSILVEGYEKLKQHLEIAGETKIMNKGAHLARLDEKVVQHMGSDCRPLRIKPPENWTAPPSAPGTFIDVWGIMRKQVYYGDDRYYWELAHSPLAEASVEDLDGYPWPDTSDPGYTAGLAEEAKELYEETDYAIMADGGFKSFWELGYLMRGHEQLLIDTALNPEFVRALMDKLLEINIAMTGRFLDAVGPYIQVFRAGDDLATQKGPFFSHETYRALIKPAHKA